jgi:hypothetical protein
MADLKAKDLLKQRNRKQIVAFADKNKFKVVEGKDYVYVGHLKCVLDHADRLMFVE